ncbi:MAG: CxxxxCH/CxxCH domain-containing protein [Desulfuromonadales bacterium]|nr:CxxxxCH/CxxCH domain-containing protein [Desulfuromonadales bacterium]
MTCTICHDPHADKVVKPTLLRATADGDLICQQCHSSRFVSNVPDTNATLTHPLVSDYEAFAAANPTKYKTLSNSASGAVRLVAGDVSCTSCHSPHFADSSSATEDGLLNIAGLTSGDGYLLRSDGPLRTGANRDGATGTGQLRSNLCQACHTYKMHGKGGNQQMIGCLDCHGGHSYNNGAISAYVLAGKSPDAVPVRALRAPAGTAQVTYAAFPDGGSVRTKWSDNTKGTANGFCEKCHGDVQNDGPGGLGNIELEHLEGGLAECTTCHKHGETTFSFANDANAATCGQCHGFPPYKNISGFRSEIGDANDGGWADNNVDLPRYGYTDSSHFLDESKAGHKTHAGAKLAVNPGEWYFVGTSGIDNCKPCHGNQSGSLAGGHRVPLSTDANTFRDVHFASTATVGGLVPSYNTVAHKCDNTYCHSNGGKRTGDGPVRSYAAHTTPAWVGTGANYTAGGYGSIFLQPVATRCADCHGYSAATMTAQGNSPVHNAHLGAGATGITYECDVCHVATADSTRASKLKLDATDGQKGGKHVNGQIEVGYKTSGNALFASLATNAVGPNYDPVTGTCSVYCHDPADIGLTADWDDTTDMQCDTCHGGIATDTSANGGIGIITSGSHTRHITTANGGPGLSCEVCHGANTTAGTHSGHLDGMNNMVPPVDGVNFADVCDECHGYDAQAGEVKPIWGNPATTDCATCHSGTHKSSGWVGAPNAPLFALDRTTGHGRPAASGNYPVTGNAPGNSACLDCHVATASGHFSGGLGDALMLRTDLGFPATYSGNENAFCANCHGTAPAHPTKTASAATRNIGTHAAKRCIGCHDLHGTANIHMVTELRATQNVKDNSATGKYSGNVSFLQITGLNSYDEDDGEVGGAGEVNADDICATCHTVAGGVLHNNSNNSAVDHFQGKDCITCHGNHQISGNAFKVRQCDDCHGGISTDTSADGGVGVITTGSHTRHITTANGGPGLSCDICHGANATIGTHPGHIDGTNNMVPTNYPASFADICDECHGYDNEPGEVKPIWGSPATTDCATCHAGSLISDGWPGAANPPTFTFARTSGHGRLPASGTYPVSGNAAGNSNCLDCHVATGSGHFSGGLGDALMLRTDVGFPATYTGNENIFCAACHSAAPTHPTKSATAATRGITTHAGKTCIACHDLHGTGNIQMVIASQTEQNTKDNSSNGQYTGSVSFLAITGANSYDEDDGAAGGAGEINGDDICATCHLLAEGVTHNNSNNSTGNHYQGEDCFTCHSGHKNATNSFIAGAGTACNDCHGNPPNTGAHGTGSNKHTRVSSNDRTLEDLTDCAYCHTGANDYTYDLGADQGAVGARANHGSGNRVAVLATSIGYSQSGNLWGCANVCHTSSAADSFWFDKSSGSDPATWIKDTNGISCNACHFYAPTVSAASVPNNLSDVHDEHFAAGKGCAECHPMTGDYNSGVGHAGPLTHIDSFDFGSGKDDNDGLALVDMAQATQDEAGYDKGGGVRDVVRAGMTYTDANTCSGGIGLGCHATGVPDWDIPIPNNNAGCLECHTDTNNGAVGNPVSGIHDNSPNGPTVTGVAHDGSFDNGSGGIADCVTCHSLTPTVVAANHMNGTINTGTAITVLPIAGYNQATSSCTTACHSAGTAWAYKWSLSAYATNGTECANCHGDYATGWVSGVAPHTENPTRGSKHNATGNLTYPCAECHGIGSPGYKWTTMWDPTGATSHHGDDKITMSNSAVHTFAIDTAPNPDRAGCTTTSCHGNDSLHNFRVTTTSLPTATVTGIEAAILCSSCHGGYVGTNANGYWPDGANAVDNGSEDNSGAHLKHMVYLAKSIYDEDLAGLLTDNGKGDADAKQKELCSYCHNAPGSDGDHGPVASLPAEVNSMYKGWLPKTADNGVWSAASKTCATVDCHFNKTTPTTNDWYAPLNNGNCAMCHVDVTVETAHTKHTSAATATTFGRASLCSDCHEAATNWGTNTGPATGHIDGVYTVAGSKMTSYVGFTYPAVKGTCGTNACHNNGIGGAPIIDPVWGTTQANCTICHAGTPATGTHVKHMSNTAWVSGGCSDCHTDSTASVISASTHMDGVRNAGGSKNVVNNANGSCTNTCHLSAEAGNWTGNSSNITCTDCHSGSGASAYIGGNKTSVGGPNYMPQYNMHLTVPTVSGKVHTAAGLATACTTCHSNLADKTTHMNGVWTADDADNTNDQHRGLFAGFTDGTVPTCNTACHSAGAAWAYKWSATAGATNGTQCDNCHGRFSTGFNAGVMHQLMDSRGNNAHTNSGNLAYPCTDCHAIGASSGNYPFANISNDWKATDAGATTPHGDGFITLNSNGTTWARLGGRSGCSACHAGATGTANNYDYPTTAWTSQTVLGDPPDVSGSCTACHGGAEYWPDGTVAPDRTGKHSAHVHAIAVQLGGDTAGNRNATCSYCHPNPGESGHNDGGSAEVGLFKNILTGAFTDPDGVLNTADSTCSLVDCHFNNAVTPHWYTDIYPPAQVTLTATTGVAAKPRSINVSWTSPGDDANVANTTVHRYDMRYGTSSAIASDFGRTDNYAGGLPLAYAQGTLQDVTIDNLTPGTTYYFSLRSQDVAGNWSTPSAVVSAVASGDTVVPYFGGVNRAAKADESQTINVEWSPAEDHTMPITYKIWVKPVSSGALDMDIDAPLLTGVKGYKYQLTSANGVVNDMIYQVGVRACDGVLPTPNCDSNTHVAYATPTDIPSVGKTYHVYRANGAIASGYVGMEKDASFTAAATSALPVTFRPAANLEYPTMYYSDSFNVYVANGNATSTIRATLGKSTGNNFTAFSPAVTADITMSARAKGIKTFKILDMDGRQVNSGESIAVQLTVVSGTVTSVGWGSAANGGALVTAERKVNVTPSNPNLQGSVNGAMVELTWTASTDTADAITDDTVHYDLYGSDDNGDTWKYLLASKLPAATTSYQWNTQLEGIALSAGATVAVKIKAGDGYGHTESIKSGLAVNNSTDNVAPNAINDLVVKRRAKAGSVILRWTAPGDDAENNGRAAYYDVRYSTAPITEGNFTAATRAYGAPAPAFGSFIQEFEINELTPLTNYYFAIKTYDEHNNAGPISTPKYTTPTPSDQEIGGPRCGMCHTTAPSVVESVGNHRIHGITINDCTKCHGDQVATFGLDHQDGLLLMGWSEYGPQQPLISGNRIYYTDDGSPGGKVLYDDPDGGGGFYNNNYNGIGDNVDDGTCLNFVFGCHGPAGSPGYGAPNWISTAKLDCADCHGIPTRTTDTFYGYAFDGTTANAGVVPEQIKGSPPIDNHGYDGDIAGEEVTRKFVGVHEKHLNYSFRFAKGDSCNLCHDGRYKDKNDLDGKHGDGYIDVHLDPIAAGENSLWIPGDAVTAGSCSNLDEFSCHPKDLLAGGTAPTPKWDSAQNFDCVQCHGFGGITPSHVTDPNKGVSLADDGTSSDQMAGNCTWCHFGGHPRGDVSGTAFVVPRNSQVGINWSTGIHLRKSIGGRPAAATEAELCWGCHDSNSISEWGADTGANNDATKPPNNSDYNYGTLSQSNWVGATWTSGTAAFGYKTGLIRSTHATADGASTAAVTTDRFRTSSEELDTVANIRCSNCHDVHNLNLAPGDETTGQPYLRGSWIRNPYPEDGAPLSTSVYAAPNKFMAVPRGGSTHNEDGGFQIDQNNGFPTAGMSVAGSAGLCTLCHGTNVDTMDKVENENLWLSTNGHSNSALGGTGNLAADIFSYAWRNPSAAPVTYTADYNQAGNPNMGYVNATTTGSTEFRADGFRSAYKSMGWGVLPLVIGTYYAYADFDWGVTQDTGTKDIGYHAFTCSKCHNPHASRLPKLMITNCLDTRHNTWDDNRPTGGLSGTSVGGRILGNDNVGRTLADVGSAQNCHRFVPKFSTTATNISFVAPDKIVSGTAIFTAANKYHVGDMVRITGGTNAGKVGKISAMTTTQLTLIEITTSAGATTTITAAGTGTSITLTGARGGWNKVTPW